MIIADIKHFAVVRLDRELAKLLLGCGDDLFERLRLEG
jgi:hypothetical protein